MKLRSTVLFTTTVVVIVSILVKNIHGEQLLNFFGHSQGEVDQGISLGYDDNFYKGLSDPRLKYFGKISELYPDAGELVTLKFLSNSDIYEPRLGEKHTYQQSFHILELHIGCRNKTFHLHLAAADDIDHTGYDSNSSDDDEDNTGADHGHYFGTITGDSTGSVALSLDEDGFSGYLIVEDEHYAIEPHSFGQTQSGHHNNHRFKRSISHRMFRTVDILKKENITTSDVLIVPQDKLEQAIREMNNYTYPEETSNETSSEVLGDVNEFDSVSNAGVPNTYAAKKKHPKINQKPKSANKKGLVSEISVFSDTKMYKEWEARFPKKAKQKIKSFILNIVQNACMNLFYAQKSLGLDFSFRLVYLEIQTTQPPDLPPDAQGETYLDTFCAYAGGKNDNNAAKWDHAMLLTGYDIMSGTSNSVIGMAYFGTMCLRYMSCSINEGSNFGTSVVLTHEMGHSLGMEHDGTGTCVSCNDETNIMSPSTGPGKVTWSSCSAKNLYDFTTTGMAGTRSNAVPKCLTKNSPLMSKQVPFSKKKLPGETYPLKYQCNLHCGKNCIPYTKAPYDDVCSYLVCQDTSTGNGGGAHPALEGSACGTGTGQYCRAGKCVSKPKSG